MSYVEPNNYAPHYHVDYGESKSSQVDTNSMPHLRLIINYDLLFKIYK